MNDTKLTLSTIDPDSSYPVFVVAYGGDLPSSHSNNEILQEGKKLYNIITFYMYSYIIL